MLHLLESTATVFFLLEFTWSLPGYYPLEPRSVAAIPIGTGAPITTATSDTQSEIIITTTDSQSTYTLTYVPPTSTATGSGSTTQSWGLVPPIVPIPFPVPPIVNPPQIPPEEPGEEPTKKISVTQTSVTDCSTLTATMTTANCTELLYVSSNQLQSTLSDCSSSYSTTSGCFVTGSASTITVDFPMPLSTNTADDDILYDRGDIYWGPDVPDVPDYVSDLYVRDTGIGPPSEPSRGDLVCATQSASGPSFIQGNALGNVMDFCAGGLNVSGPPITKTYVQPTGGDALYIEAIFVDDEGACFPGETVNWDEDRCKFILNRPIFECEPDSNPQTQIAKYGGKIAADCVNITVTPQSVPESVFCGAFDDGGGMGFKAFTPDEANDAIDKYCNSDTYTADPSYDTTPYGVRIIGYALDRFWYKNGVYCMTTSPRPPPPNIPADQSACHSDGSMDFELDVGVKFKTDQTGCQPMKPYVVPRGDECVNTLKKVVSGCNLGAPDFGGKVDDDSDSGCLEWWVYAAGSQI